MQVFICRRCGTKHDFSTRNTGRLCDHCGAPLAYHGQEISPWGEHPMKDYDAPAWGAVEGDGEE